MPLRHFKETQNAGAIGAPLGGNRANPGKHPRGNSGAIGGAIGPPPGGNWDPPKGVHYAEVGRRYAPKLLLVLLVR